MPQSELRRTRVVIVDDSRTMQAVLEHLLTDRLNCDVVGVARDGEAARTLVRRLAPDLVTIDLAMPYIDGYQLLCDLAAFSEMKKVVISASARDSLAIRAKLESAGADGFIHKSELSRDPADCARLLASILRREGSARLPDSTRTARAVVKAPQYPIPVDEQARLAALAAFGLANDDQDHRLDLLTEHLVKTTSFSACVMTFIDQHTQWVKSAVGFERGAIDRAQAICNYTICGDEPFIVTDATADKRFKDLDVVVTGPRIRSYVGHPIIDSAGVRIGAICLIDTKPRSATVKELTNLRSIARIAAGVIETLSAPRRAA